LKSTEPNSSLHVVHAEIRDTVRYGCFPSLYPLHWPASKGCIKTVLLVVPTYHETTSFIYFCLARGYQMCDESLQDREDSRVGYCVFADPIIWWIAIIALLVGIATM
jgi:hypothetical protein